MSALERRHVGDIEPHCCLPERRVRADIACANVATVMARRLREQKEIAIAHAERAGPRYAPNDSAIRSADRRRAWVAARDRGAISCELGPQDFSLNEIRLIAAPCFTFGGRC